MSAPRFDPNSATQRTYDSSQFQQTASTSKTGKMSGHEVKNETGMKGFLQKIGDFCKSIFSSFSSKSEQKTSHPPPMYSPSTSSTTTAQRRESSAPLPTFTPTKTDDSCARLNERGPNFPPGLAPKWEKLDDGSYRGIVYVPRPFVDSRGQKIESGEDLKNLAKQYHPSGSVNVGVGTLDNIRNQDVWTLEYKLTAMQVKISEKNLSASSEQKEKLAQDLTAKAAAKGYNLSFERDGEGISVSAKGERVDESEIERQLKELLPDLPAVSLLYNPRMGGFMEHLSSDFCAVHLNDQ